MNVTLVRPVRSSGAMLRATSRLRKIVRSWESVHFTHAAILPLSCFSKGLFGGQPTLFELRGKSSHVPLIAPPGSYDTVSRFFRLRDGAKPANRLPGEQSDVSLHATPHACRGY